MAGPDDVALTMLPIRERGFTGLSPHDATDASTSCPLSDSRRPPKEKWTWTP